MPTLMLDDDKDDKQVTVTLSRLLVRESLLASALGTAAAVDEYIDEFEHQEGDDCWSNFFKNADEAVDDFRLYIGALGE
jgi:hypothetical protein